MYFQVLHAFLHILVPRQSVKYYSLLCNTTMFTRSMGLSFTMFYEKSMNYSDTRHIFYQSNQFM